MPTPYEPARPATEPQAPTRPPRPPLVRPTSSAWTPGVCRAIATHLGVSVRSVRWVTVLLSIVGAGIPAYVFVWALTPAGNGVEGEEVPGASSPSRQSVWAAVVVGGVLLVALGAAAGTGVLAGTPGSQILLPLLIITAGAIVAWSNLDETQRSSWLGASGGTRLVWLRVGLGLGVAVVGILVLVTRGDSIGAVWDALLAALGVLAGVLLIAAPWMVRLWSDFRREQVASARATERADIAAHLHDSVLQTLALIQRQSDDPTAVTRLARAQERELRTWLYAGPTGDQSTLAAAVTAVAHEVEDLHGIPVELVVTGDRELEPHGNALVRALREALLNAVRHGAPPVSAYVEIGPTGVEAFVRDRGVGFDLDEVAEDRLGVRASILGRMERHGGSARVRRMDDGTEVELRLPPIEGELS